MCWNTGSLYIFRNIYHHLGLAATHLQKAHRSERILRCASSIAKQHLYCKFVSQLDPDRKNISRELNPFLMYVNRAPTLWIWFCGAFLRHGFCRYFSGTPQGWPMLPSTQIVNDKIIHTGSGLHRHRFKTCQQQFKTLRGIRKVIDYDNERWSRRVPFKPDDTINSVHNLLR